MMILNVLKEMRVDYIVSDTLISVQDTKEKMIELIKKLDGMGYQDDTYGASAHFGWEAANKETVKEILITRDSNPNGYIMIAFNSIYREGRN